MRHELKNFTDQFQAVYIGPNWIGDSILSVPDNITAQIAFQKPPGDRHSIAEILKHIMLWNNIWDRHPKKVFDKFFNHFYATN